MAYGELQVLNLMSCWEVVLSSLVHFQQLLPSIHQLCATESYFCVHTKACLV